MTARTAGVDGLEGSDAGAVDVARGDAGKHWREQADDEAQQDVRGGEDCVDIGGGLGHVAQGQDVVWLRCYFRLLVIVKN